METFSVTYNAFENSRDELANAATGLETKLSELSSISTDVSRLHSLENKGYPNRISAVNKQLGDLVDAIKDMSSKLEQIRDRYRETETANLKNLNEKIQPENSKGFSEESRRSAEAACIVAEESESVDNKSNDGIFVKIGSFLGIKTIITEKTYHNKHTITHDKDSISDDAKEERVAAGSEKEIKWGLISIGGSSAVGSASAGYGYGIGKGKLKGEATAASADGHIKIGTDDTYLQGGLEGKVGTVEAKAELSNEGFELKAGANALEVKGKAKAKILGIKIDGDVKGSAGLQAGAKGGIKVNSGGISIKAGGAAILGLDVDIKIDWTDSKIYKAIVKK